MKKLLLTIIALILFAGVQINAQTLTVNVTGVKETKGQIYIAVFDSSSFLQKGVAGKIVAVDSKSMKVDFDALPDGEYAIALFHDVNGNGIFDMKMAGLKGVPAERYGFSNNAIPIMSPPSFETCKFELKGNKTISIMLQ